MVLLPLSLARLCLRGETASCLCFNFLALAPLAAAFCAITSPLLRPQSVLLEFLVDRDQLVLLHPIRLIPHEEGVMTGEGRKEQEAPGEWASQASDTRGGSRVRIDDHG